MLNIATPSFWNLLDLFVKSDLNRVWYILDKYEVLPSFIISCGGQLLVLDIVPEPVASLKVQLGHAKAPLRKAKETPLY